MPFALVPEGFKLQKVTKLQKAAVDQYYSNEATKAFLEGDASSEAVKAVAIVVTPIILAALTARLAASGNTDFDIVETLKIPSRIASPLAPIDASLAVLTKLGLITKEQEQQLREDLPGV
jgi:hypothetical protein